MSDYSTLPADAPRPRLCHLRKWEDYTGYGFNLHAERGKAGQFVGTIDLGSPAEVTELRAGDRIVEVNGTNIGSENHQQVVQRIKAVANETTILVVDSETDAYYRDRKIVVRGDMPNIEHHETPELNPFTHRNSGLAGAMNTMGLSEIDYEKYPARLCRLRTWPDFVGYGFNVHADRSKKGEYIGKVDAGSPALASGLLEGDRVVEVNGVLVGEKSHAEVVAMVKSRPNEVDLLVVDEETFEYYRSHDIIMHGSMRGVRINTCPVTNPNTANGDVEHKVQRQFSESSTANEFSYQREESLSFASANSDESRGYIDSRESVQTEPEVVQVAYTEPKELPVVEVEEEHTVPAVFHTTRLVIESDAPQSSGVEAKPFDGNQAYTSSHSVAPDPVVTSVSYSASASSHSVAPDQVVTSVSYSASASSNTSRSSVSPPAAEAKPVPVTVGGLEFAGSAKEARERMNKKRNVKNDPNLSLKDKYNILQSL